MKKHIAVFKETFTEFGQDKAPRLGAALAYYTIFSIGPLLLIAISMAGIFLGPEAAQGRISDELGKVFGTQMAEALEKMIAAANKPEGGAIATIVGVVTLLLGASGVFGQLKDALNTIWNVEPPKAGGIMGFLKLRFLSMAMVFGIGFLLLVALVLDAVIAAMGSRMEHLLPGGEVVLQASQLLLSFGLITVLFAAMFRILPDIDISWHDVWFGAAFTSFLFVIGKFGLGYYFGKAAVGSSYGAAGSLVLLLVWVYWSAQILFFGAEFTQVYARTYGSLKGDTSKREARAGAKKPEDRPKAETDASGKPIPIGATHGRPAPAYARTAAQPKKGGSLGKVAAGGAAGLLIGLLVGGLSAISMVLKSIRKLIPIR
jgi:membrane protein